MKTTKTLNICWCGCGGLTKSRFVPGHDARFHSDAKKVARGEISDEDLPALPNDEANAEFERCVEHERPIWAAKKAAKEAEKAEREAKKAATKAAKEELEAKLKAAKAEAKAATERILAAATSESPAWFPGMRPEVTAS